MAVLINDLETDGIFKIVIDLQKAFDPEVPEQKVYFDRYEGAQITVRELTPKEGAALSEDKTGAGFIDKLKDTIIDHTFEKKDGSKAEPSAVAALIAKSTTLAGYVSKEIVERHPLLRKSGEKSETSQGL